MLTSDRANQVQTGVGYTGMPAGECREATPIEQQLQQLDKQLGALSHNVGELIGSILPILRHDPRQVGLNEKEGKDIIQCPLENELKQMNERLMFQLSLIARARELSCL